MERTTKAITLMASILAGVVACAPQEPTTNDESPPDSEAQQALENQLKQIATRLDQVEARHETELIGVDLLGEIQLAGGNLFCTPPIDFMDVEADVVRFGADRATAEENCLNSLPTYPSDACDRFCRDAGPGCVGSVSTSGEIDSYSSEVVAEIPVGPEVPTETLESPTGIDVQFTQETVAIRAHGVSCSGKSFCTCSREF